MKKQIKFQKILFIVTLIVAALTLVYGFSFCTGALSYAFNARSGAFPTPLDEDPINADALYQFVMGKGEFDGEVWANAGIGFNDLIVIMGVIFVVIAALQFFFATNSRRNYYITNYISVGVLVVFGVIIAAVAFWGIAHSEALFNNIDWVRYKEVYESIINAPDPDHVGIGWDLYSDSHVMFTLGYILFSLVLVNMVILVLNTVWKTLLMKGEKALLSKNMNITEAEVLQ